MDIRLLAYQDHRLIAEIAFWQFHQWGHLWANNTLTRTYNRILARTNQSFLPLTIVITKKDELQGFACLIAHGMWNYLPNRQPWLDSVYVKQTSRQQGVGNMLVQMAQDFARSLSYNEMFLYTPDQERFYHQRGWFALERLHYEHEFVTIMKKKLLD